MLAQGSPQSVLEADLLERTFGVPCKIIQQDSSMRIDFYPPEQTEHVTPQMGQVSHD
jgi:ABC-type cobalamin/Fe3+-siderophores transport system ATPase subunit